MGTEPYIVLDFETYPIYQRPHYPPPPVGLATKWPDAPPQYLAFGHVAGGNNAVEEMAAAEVERVWQSGLPILCHHSKFDIEVAAARYGVPIPEWPKVHDTEYLAFLENPHARSLELKVLAEQLLGMPPAERDLMVEWCKAHEAELPGIWLKQFGSPNPDKFTPSRIGQWIWLVPGDLAGPYAIGDLERTAGLFEHYQTTRERMSEAYDRERRLMPILLRNEQQGLRVDLGRLEQDIARGQSSMEMAESWLRWRLGAPSLNLDADQDVAERLNSAGIVTEWAMTKPTKSHPSGQRSMSKETLRKEKYSDPEVFRMLGYRNRLKTSLDTFMVPWAEQARINAGRITTTWNQVRGADATGSFNGTRTGRPSTHAHNFLNLPKAFEGRTSDGWEHPTALELARLPLCRDYILPEEGHLWLHRDFDGQELRVFAHYECGQLLQAYLDNPDLDPHEHTRQNIFAITAKNLERTRVKNGTFARLYGGGVPAVKWQAQCKSENEARELIALLDKGMPGRAILDKTLQALAGAGQPIVTWGGRWYYPERVPGQDKRYKLLNYLDQGSAADITKQALIDWDAQAMSWERLLVTVYDEINISAPIENARESLARLGTVMNKDWIDCPMRSSAKIGTTWGNAVKEKGDPMKDTIWSWEQMKGIAPCAA